MEKIMKVCTTGIACLAVILSFAASVSAETISGTWTDPSVQSNAVIVQRGNRVTITNTFSWQGKEVQWRAQGTRNGNTVSVRYFYTKNRPAGWENGTMNFLLTGGNTLSGKWVSESRRYSQNITFTLVQRQDPRAERTPPKRTKRATRRKDQHGKWVDPDRNLRMYRSEEER
mgnify:FL=1